MKAPLLVELKIWQGDMFVLTFVVTAKTPNADFVRTLAALLLPRLMVQPQAAPFPFPAFYMWPRVSVMILLARGAITVTVVFPPSGLPGGTAPTIVPAVVVRVPGRTVAWTIMLLCPRKLL